MISTSVRLRATRSRWNGRRGQAACRHFRKQIELNGLVWPKPGTKSRKAKFRLSMLLSDDPETSDFDQKLEIRLPNVRRPQRRVSNVVILEALDQSGLQQFWNAVSPRNPQNPEAPLSGGGRQTDFDVGPHRCCVDAARIVRRAAEIAPTRMPLPLPLTCYEIVSTSPTRNSPSALPPISSVHLGPTSRPEK
jgi:hypothetical protein